MTYPMEENKGQDKIKHRANRITDHIPSGHDNNKAYDIPDFRKMELPFLMQDIFSLETVHSLLPVQSFDRGIFESHHQTKSNSSWIGQTLLRTSLI